MAEQDRTEAETKLWSLIDDIRTAMMTSVDGDVLRSRPMQGFVDQEHRLLWFFTKRSAHKTAEINRDSHVNLSYTDPKHQQYVSISGRAQLVVDRDKAKELWTPFVQAWFPEGPDDPDVALIRVSAEQGEYWDGPSSTLVQLWRISKALAERDQPDMGEERKVNLS